MSAPTPREAAIDAVMTAYPEHKRREYRAVGERAVRDIEAAGLAVVRATDPAAGGDLGALRGWFDSQIAHEDGRAVDYHDAHAYCARVLREGRERLVAAPEVATEGGGEAAGLARIQGALVRERDGWAHSVPVRACFDRVLDVLDDVARRAATPREQGTAEAATAGGDS